MIELNVEDGKLKNADDLPPMSLESKLMSEELKSCGTKDLDTFDSSEWDLIKREAFSNENEMLERPENGAVDGNDDLQYCQ